MLKLDVRPDPSVPRGNPGAADSLALVPALLAGLAATGLHSVLPAVFLPD